MSCLQNWQTLVSNLVARPFISDFYPNEMIYMRERDVRTEPVKLLRPEHSLRKKNIDRMYAKSFIDDMMSISELIGGDAVTSLSNDDKARIA